MSALVFAFFLLILGVIFFTEFGDLLMEQRLLRPDEVPEIPEDNDGPPPWLCHQKYQKDPQGILCEGCGKTFLELFYGHCRDCCQRKDIPVYGD